MKIVEYMILVEQRNSPLSLQVNEMIGDGYQPFGIPYLTRNGAEKQAMVKYEDLKALEATQPLERIPAKETKPKKGVKKDAD